MAEETNRAPASPALSPLRSTIGYGQASAASRAVPPALTSLKATIGSNQAASAPAAVAAVAQLPSLKATLGTDARPLAPPVAFAPSPDAHPHALAATLAATTSAPVTPDPRKVSLGTTSATRTTVLPRTAMTGDDPVAHTLPRYERLKPLGEGGVGEVVLAQDHDIERKVAIKRLRQDALDASSILRFADEVRAVGKLEHPAIVPIHDVGIDESGQHYIVMKYVDGETLEAIIEKLMAGDPDYLARFTHERRARVFLAILQAVRYAHSRGIIHRDIKPANIMVGPHGEVTLMDWGLAKTVKRDAAAASVPSTVAVDVIANPPRSARLLETQQGALLGTPLYMSPEQAMGNVDQLDERSDIYSLSVLWYELMTLKHPLASCQSLPDVLTTIVTRDYTRVELVATALQVGAPCEYYHFMVEGLARDPAKRYASVEVMERELEAILNGRVAINCHITLTKRVGFETLHWIDRHKVAFTVLFLAATVLGVVETVSFVRHLV